MKEPSAVLRLRGESRTFAPGDRLAGEYQWKLPQPRNLRAIEVSVLWYTEGKGEEDIGVHFFERLSAEQLAERVAAGAEGGPIAFETILPRSPLSYDGVLLRVHWCARVRLFLSRGRQVIVEQPFRLGHVPPSRAVRVEARDNAAEERIQASPHA